MSLQDRQLVSLLFFSSGVENILQTTILQVDVSKLAETPIYTNILEQVLAIRKTLVERLRRLRKGEVKVCDGRLSQDSEVREMIVRLEEILLQTVSVQTTQPAGLRTIADLLISLQVAINNQVMEILTLPSSLVSSSPSVLVVPFSRKGLKFHKAGKVFWD